MLVRDAKKGDIDAITKLYKDFCRELGTPEDSLPIMDEGKMVVCELSNNLIGYGTARAVVYSGKNYSQGEHLYVRPEHRKKGAAGLIYKALCRWGAMRGQPFILLSAPEEYDMWLKKGYKPIRYIMVKEIKCTK